MLQSLDLFSGIGGISLALKEYAKPIAYCEIDRYAQSVLLSRMVDGSIETAPILRDITRIDGTKFRGHVDLICGGFPCQDISVAGNGAGLEGKRSGLFFEIVRLVKEIQPAFVFLENVPAIRTRGLDRVCFELAKIGYDLRWTVISAASVGANHKRERWFLLGYSKHNGRATSAQPRRNGANYKKEQTRQIGSCESSRAGECRDVSKDVSDVANTLCEGLEGHGKLRKTFSEERPTLGQSANGNKQDGKDWWATEPSVCRVVDELPNRVDRIKCLGNSVVPLQAKTAFEKLMGYL